MKKIEDLLQKFKSLGLTEHKIKDVVIDVVKEELNIELEKKAIEFKDRRIRLKIFGPSKTEIVLKKNAILEKINSEVEDLNIKVLDIN